MKPLITILLFLFTLQITAQDPILQHDKDTFEAKASQLTAKYDAQLALDSKQRNLFRRKLEEFLIREKKINEEFEGKEKLNLLYRLRKAESLEMRNILTKPQFDLYKQIKPKLQPLAVVEGSNDK